MSRLEQVGFALFHAATFPRTRWLAGRLLQRRLFRALLWWWASVLVLVAYALLRGKMDDLGLPRHGAELDERVFGTLPSVWLQSHLLGLGPSAWEWVSVVIHSSWFFVPPLAGILVSFRRPDRLGSFFRWWIALELLALPLFALFPTKPPWMESDSVIRIIALRQGGTISDSNPLAAVPSLHVAFPLMITFWFLRERWKAPAAAMLAYTALVSFEVVFSGEHYVADVLGAAVVAAAIALAAKVDYRPIWNWTRSRAREAFSAADSPATEPALASRARLHHRERAQALIEFAFIGPLMFLFLFAIVDFGIAVDRRLVLQHAVREGSRFGAVHSTGNAATTIDDIEDRTVEQAQDIITTSDVTVCYVDQDAPPNGSAGNVGDAVKVRADFDWNFPILSEMANAFGIGPLQIHMNPSGTGRLEKTVPGAPACPAPTPTPGP